MTIKAKENNVWQTYMCDKYDRCVICTIVWALNLLPRGVLGTPQHSQSLAETSWGLLR